MPLGVSAGGARLGHEEAANRWGPMDRVIVAVLSKLIIGTLPTSGTLVITERNRR